MKNIPMLGFIFLLCILNLAGQTPAPTITNNEKSLEIVQKISPASTASSESPAQTGEKKSDSSYVKKTTAAQIPHFETAPVIDGQLNDAVWQTAAVFGDFLQTQPGDNIAPSNPTEVMIGYDAKNLYMAFRAKQARDIRATVNRRDNVFNDDFVFLYLDTFNDQRQAYIFLFNPLGIQADGVFTEGNGEDYSVDVVMESKGVVTADGYTVEVAIPFKSLRYEAGKGKQWGIQLFRRIKYNNNELDSWMPNDRRNSSALGQAGHITGLESIATTRQLELNPSVTLSQSGSRVRTIPVAVLQTNRGVQDPGKFINDGIKADVGFTAKFGLTPAITLDFAYNPDFAQVEADAPVVTANQRFPIFFAEKRPFFLERIDIFQTQINAVNTRSIVDPDVAVKLTGRRGSNTFGILYASDKYPGYTAFTEDQRTDPTLRKDIERYLNKNAQVGVVRFKHDIGTKHNLGFLATTYNFVDRHNNTGGFDGRFRFDPKTTLQFQVLGSTTRGSFYDPDLDKSSYRTGNGVAYEVYLERADRNLYMNYLAFGKSRDYRADVGFTQRLDTNYLGSFIKYQTERDAKKSIIYKRWQNATNFSYDWKARLQNWNSNSQFMLALQKQTFWGVGFQYGFERVFEHEFGANRSATRQGAFFGPDPERSAYNKTFYSFLETTPNKKVAVNMEVDYTIGQLDYDFGAGPDFPRVSRAALLSPDNPLDPGTGNQLFYNASINYQPMTAFQTQLDYKKTRLVRDDTKRTAFDDNIFSSRSIYQFTRNIFARLRLDYSTLNKHIRPQVVLGWTPSPGTAVYIGYNDDMSYNGYNQFTGQFEPGLRGNGRTFFIKASYLFKRSF